MARAVRSTIGEAEVKAKYLAAAEERAERAARERAAEVSAGTSIGECGEAELPGGLRFSEVFMVDAQWISTSSKFATP